MAFTKLSNILKRLGPTGVLGLALRKIAKWLRYRSMLATVPTSSHVAILKNRQNTKQFPELAFDKEAILLQADAMLRDMNIFFSFPYRTRNIERPWEFDPLENKYWPRRHYTERKLHDRDTPNDVKIVFEINRFKDIPTLGQAALLSDKKEYAEEVERRLLSWIEDNPFASSVNWSSALEVSIRLISWTTTLLLLKEAGFNTHEHTKIRRSIFEQAHYLAADLGTDKVLPTNHLIGEATGLYLTSMLCEFPGNQDFAKRAKRILEKEIIGQTFSDGVTREASSWYHQFVTHFFDLAHRVAIQNGNPFSDEYKTRLSRMKAFLRQMKVDGNLVRFGDCDDGLALWMEGNHEIWKDHIFGTSDIPDFPPQNYYPNVHHVAAHVNDAFLFLRAGEFGMGGAGFSSHAHDDFLSPIIYLAGLPVLVDPGTFVYSGDQVKRAQYREASAHNGIVFGNGTGAIPRKQFGWERIRPDAIIYETNYTPSEASVKASYGEWPEHQRTVKINQTTALIEDLFLDTVSQHCEWRLHLAPEWIMESNPSSFEEGTYYFRNTTGKHLTVTVNGNFETISAESYDYSPSYRVEVNGTLLRLTASNPAGIFTIQFTIDTIN
jgi:hypothetical protein